MQAYVCTSTRITYEDKCLAAFRELMQIIIVTVLVHTAFLSLDKR